MSTEERLARLEVKVDTLLATQKKLEAVSRCMSEDRARLVGGGAVLVTIGGGLIWIVHSIADHMLTKHM